MANNPYANSEDLANLLWETEMVADKYSNGGLILIKTKDGWKAFLGSFTDEALRTIEKTLDNNIPRNYKLYVDEIPRSPTLIKELEGLLPDCMCFPGYRPMKFIDELE